MLAAYKETETAASRVLYINSKDATTTFQNSQSDFVFSLEEPIVVPEHHTMLMSVYSAEIPYSFYNFRVGVNCRLDYAITVFGLQADYDANGFLDLAPAGARSMPLPEGNWNAVELANYISTHVYSAGPLYPLEVKFDPISLKFKFRCLIAGIRVTLGLINGAGEREDMNEELGFDGFNTIGDPFVERDAAGLQPYWYGYTNPPAVPPGVGVDTGLSGPFLTDPEYYLFGDDVVDMTNSIRSLFLRTNLSTTSVLDSHIGGGFSNILTRVPINAEPGGIITIKPTDGDVHKLLLKVKAITDIAITLTNQENQVINLNGLTFDISLKLEFIADKELKPAPNHRLDYQQTLDEAQLKLTTPPPSVPRPRKKPSQTKKKKTKKPQKKK
mgnify:FL=1|tara:strand:+ start:8009 stop:9163 length:1155 start_codon:yes stop_codon:yes gene_type:complete